MSLNVDLLKETFNRAKEENGGLKTLGLRFYERLFEKYPQVKHLFHTPPEEQHKKLMASVGATIASLTEPERMVPFLQAMGVRHLKYKTESAHYGAVAENLVAVLGEHLSKEGEWTSDMQTAWEDALKAVSDIMIEAAENPESCKESLLKAGYDADGFRKDTEQPWVLVN
ncbi:MAG: flavohemoprotein [Candidatus Obscuribacterales bacterium]|nr:flavohemoprotein [Cyanobacteria bacterium HKST-UBA01]MCB9471649.1 flavohemoprotein [Candidatus Obscuribacterales bacterium]